MLASTQIMYRYQAYRYTLKWCRDGRWIPLRVVLFHENHIFFYEYQSLKRSPIRQSDTH